MHADHLIGMANRIALFFAAMPEADEARDGVAQHLKKFWEPRMRRQLLALVDTPEAEQLHPLVREVIEAGQVTA